MTRAKSSSAGQLGLDGVVDAWRQAQRTDIHPSLHVGEDAYWASGAFQAQHAAQYAAPHSLVLDFGCGDGRVAVPLALLGYDVVGADASQAMLDGLRTHACSRGVGEEIRGASRVRPLSTNGMALRAEVRQQLGMEVGEDGTGGFDLVVSRAVLIHHDHEAGAALVGELASVLRPGGYLVADWPLSAHGGTGPEHVRRDWIDVTTWTRERQLQVAGRAGLTPVEDDQPTVWRKAERADGRVG